MTEKEAQNRKILRYLSDGNSITDAVARNLFQCSRIAARIKDLKNAGVPIDAEFDYEYDDRGKVVKKWKKYWIAQ